jgi:hypothetical protein
VRARPLHLLEDALGVPAQQPAGLGEGGGPPLAQEQALASSASSWATAWLTEDWVFPSRRAAREKPFSRVTARKTCKRKLSRGGAIHLEF